MIWSKWVTNSSFAILDLSAGRGWLGLAHLPSAPTTLSAHTTTCTLMGTFSGQKGRKKDVWWSYLNIDGLHQMHVWDKVRFNESWRPIIHPMTTFMATSFSWCQFWPASSILQCTKKWPQLRRKQSIGNTRRQSEALAQLRKWHYWIHSVNFSQLKCSRWRWAKALKCLREASSDQRNYST